MTKPAPFTGYCTGNAYPVYKVDPANPLIGLYYCPEANTGRVWGTFERIEPAQTMTRQELETRLQAIHQEHRALHQATVKAVNEYIAANPDGLSVTQQADPSGPWKIETLVHDMLHNAAWIEDRLAGIVVPSHRDYRRSLTKKVRRIMGYSCP